MITITIDGISIHTEPTKTIIEAAFENGIYIPHFCWHPALSISGNCRMCLVEVEKMPKQVIACSTRCMDGMVVHVNSDKAIQAREAVMEFILINHPLDCPICDEAGECKLQDYAYKYSVGESRFDEEKNQKQKRVALGPHVMFDGERCISCSRCIRFCEDIVKEPQLTFVERGDRVTIETYPGKQLDNAYSMNVVDICPVGALTSREFRFAARTWDLSSTPSVCAGCAKGCNTEVWVRQNRILRLTPRENHDVNGFWMCDEGRVKSFEAVHAETRITRPFVGRGDQRTEVSWDAAISAAVAHLRGRESNRVAVLGSGLCTSEDNYALVRLGHELLGTTVCDLLPHEDPRFADTLLRQADRHPNTRGARLAGMVSASAERDTAALLAELRAGAYDVLLIADSEAAQVPGFIEALGDSLVVIGLLTHAGPVADRADVILPAAMWAETSGVWVSGDAQAQVIRPAIVTAENERWNGGYAMSRLDRFGSAFDRWGRTEKPDVRSVWKIVQSLAAALGATWSWSHAEDVFDEMAERLPAFAHLSHEGLGRQGRRLEGEAPAHPISYTYSDVHQ